MQQGTPPGDAQADDAPRSLPERILDADHMAVLAVMLDPVLFKKGIKDKVAATADYHPSGQPLERRLFTRICGDVWFQKQVQITALGAIGLRFGEIISACVETVSDPNRLLSNTSTR